MSQTFKDLTIEINRTEMELFTQFCYGEASIRISKRMDFSLVEHV